MDRICVVDRICVGERSCVVDRTGGAGPVGTDLRAVAAARHAAPPPSTGPGGVEEHQVAVLCGAAANPVVVGVGDQQDGVAGDGREDLSVADLDRPAPGASRSDLGGQVRLPRQPVQPGDVADGRRPADDEHGGDAADRVVQSPGVAPLALGQRVEVADAQVRPRPVRQPVGVLRCVEVLQAEGARVEVARDVAAADGGHVTSLSGVAPGPGDVGPGLSCRRGGVPGRR